MRRLFHDAGEDHANLLPDAVVQEILANNTRQALLHLVRLSPVWARFRRNASLRRTERVCVGGVWHGQIIIFIWKHDGCMLHTMLTRVLKGIIIVYFHKHKVRCAEADWMCSREVVFVIHSTARTQLCQSR